MRTLTKLKIIFLILLGILAFLCIYPNNNVKALTQSQAAQAIAEFALNVANNHAAETYYVSPESYHRVNAYKGIKTYSVDGKKVFGFDCNGFVSFVVHNSIGIGGESFTKFAYPVTSKWVPNGGYFYEVASGLTLDSALSIAQVGDLICSNGDGSTHIQIYVGNEEIVDCAGSYPNAVQIRGENRPRDIRHAKGSFTVLRISAETAAQVKESDVKIWLDEIGVVREDMKEYYDQKGEIILKNEDGSYSYEDGGTIKYENGQYVNENGEIVEINSSSIVVNEKTGQVIGTVKEVLKEYEFQGILRVQRTESEDQEPRDLKYISLEEMYKKEEADDVTALDYYSISGDSLVVAKSEQTVVTINGIRQAENTTIIDLLNIEYKTIVSKYSMPFEFQLALQAISQNPEFIIELCDFQRQGEMILVLQDYTVIDTTKYERLSNITTKRYEISDQTAQLELVSEEGPTVDSYIEEIKITTKTPVLNVKSADTWIYKVENTYTSTYNKQGGEPQVSKLDPTTDEETYGDGSKIETTTETTVTNTYTVEKITWNQGPSDKQSKEESVLPLLNELYEVPNEDTLKSAGGVLTSGAQMLFALLESNEKTQEHSKIMRYLLYKHNNEEKYYGVTDLDFTSIEEKFYTMEENTTHDTLYDTTSYTSFVDNEGSDAGRAVATVAEYFIRVGNSKNLLIYSQDANRNKGFKFELASGKTEKRTQQTTYKDKLVYDCSSFISAMYNLVVGVPPSAWSTNTFDSYRKEEIDGSKDYFYCVGTYDEVKDQLQPGDILMADKSMGNKWDHAMIYLGNGRIAHASSSNDLVISNVWESTNYVLRLKPGVATSINTKVTWPDGQVENVQVKSASSSSDGDEDESGSSDGGMGEGLGTDSGETQYGEAFDTSLMTMDELELFERVVASEARGEPFVGQVAVAAVVLNRVEVRHGGKTTIRDVLLAENQFARPYTGTISQSVKDAVQRALAGEDPTITPLMSNGALYFNKMGMPTKENPDPNWYTSRCGNKVKIIGVHVFYREWKPWNN